MPTDFCRSRCGSCCIRGRRRRSARSKRRCSRRARRSARRTHARSKLISASAASSTPGAATRKRRRTRWSGCIGGDCCASRGARTASGCITLRRCADGAPPPADRLRSLIMVYARIFAPSPEKSLQSVIARHRELGSTRQTFAEMIRDGELRRDIVDGVSYVSPADERRAARRRARCVSLRRSTRSCGTGRGSSICGDGRTGSRRIRR